MVEGAHESRFIRCKCRTSWPRRHSPFEAPQVPNNKLSNKSNFLRLNLKCCHNLANIILLWFFLNFFRKWQLYQVSREKICTGVLCLNPRVLFIKQGDISTLDETSLKLVDKFTYLGSSVSSTEKNIDTRLTKVWTAIDRLSIIWKSDLTDKMKRSFFQAAIVSILLYGCTTWTLTKRLEKKLDSNYTRMLRAILNKSWRQHPTNYTATCLHHENYPS